MRGRRAPAILALAGWCGASSASAAASDPAAELRALTEARFAANAANDRAFYERLLAPNAVVMLPFRAPQTRAAYLEEEFGARPASYRGPQVTLSEFEAHVDGTAAVVGYRVVEPVPLGDQAFEMRTRRLDTYVRVGGAWRLQSMVVTELPTWPDVATVDPRILAAYAGTYEAPGQSIAITVEDGRLMMAIAAQAKVELFAENATTFFDRTDSPLARTVFERDASDRVVAQVYRAHGQTLRALKVR